MADTLTRNLTSGSAAQDADRIPICRDPAGTPLDRYLTIDAVRARVLAPFALPVNGDFSDLNIGTSTVTVRSSGAITFSAQYTSGSWTGARGRIKTAPSTPYEIVARLGLRATLVDYQHAGLIAHANGGGLNLFGPVSTSGGMYLAVYNYTNATTFGSSLAQVALPPGIDPANVFLHLIDDGADRKYGWSIEGWDTDFLHTEGRTTNFTADRVGWGAASWYAGNALASLFSWEQR